MILSTMRWGNRERNDYFGFFRYFCFIMYFLRKLQFERIWEFRLDSVGVVVSDCYFGVCGRIVYIYL